ncbi:phenylalanine--tRNA ligase subunit alpha [Candidatus Wolfebacteria bacterium]|nr:MAG: phenylalanine--tRNA ligase subunit alpha [Candidatus Wolfebacteria bacterium]
MENNDKKGHLHPLTQVMQEVTTIFGEMGFSIEVGPEIEDEWHNFDALNVPKDHPARDMQDTFFVKGKKETVMRTHTSPVQIHYMQEHEPPIKIIVPGKVFRHEATDATHEAQFHQIEGLYVDKDVSIAHLKGILLEFFKRFLGEEVEIRLRPGYFPFVEPGVEVDLKFKGKWLEVLGAGMVHPNVLKNVNIDPEKYKGLAFGIGLDRLMMMKYNIPDVRLSYEGDLRFVNQF